MSVKYFPAPLRFRPKQTKQPAKPKAGDTGATQADDTGATQADDTGKKPTPRKKAKK